MKNFAAILSILSVVVKPCLAQGDNAVEAVDDAACVSETAVISENQDIRNAYDAMEGAMRANVTANPSQFCDLISLECTIDFGEYSSSFEIVCEAEGGQLVERDLKATCNGTVVIPVTYFEIAVERAPICVGLSCVPTAIPDEIEAGFVTLVEDIVDEVNASVDGTLVCVVEIDGGGVGGGGGDGEKTLMPGGGDVSDTTPAPSGDDSAPTPSEPAPTSGAQATTIWGSATGLTLLSFIWR